MLIAIDGTFDRCASERAEEVPASCQSQSQTPDEHREAALVMVVVREAPSLELLRRWCTLAPTRE